MTTRMVLSRDLESTRIPGRRCRDTVSLSMRLVPSWAESWVACPACPSCATSIHAANHSLD